MTASDKRFRFSRTRPQSGSPRTRKVMRKKGATRPPKPSRPPESQSLLRSLLARQLIRQFVRVVDLAKGLDTAPAVHAHRPGLLLVEDEVQYQRLDVAVEDQADHLGALVHDRAARVAADDVRGADEVERRRQVELCPALDPPGREVERRLVVVVLRPGVEALERRVRGHPLAVLLVALDRAV